MSKRIYNKQGFIRDPLEDRVLYTIVGVVLTLFTIIVAYPIIYVLSSSFSSGVANSTGRVVLWPVDFSLEGYKTAHRYIGSAYRNTIFYTVAGTLINLFVTLTCAYPLSRKDFPLQKFFMGLFLLRRPDSNLHAGFQAEDDEHRLGDAPARRAFGLQYDSRAHIPDGQHPARTAGSLAN